MARFFITRPVFAIVISLIILIVGALAGLNLPIEQYPQISPPTVNVSTQYLGANAQVVESTVANAIEQQVNGAEGMVDMQATSDNNGSYSLNITFELERDQDMATVDVQNRVATALASLPAEVTESGVTTKKQSPNTVMYFALYSPNQTYDQLFLKNYGSINFVNALKRVDGVSTVSEYGPEYSMRIWLKPDRMAQLNVTSLEVANAIQKQSVQSPTGTIGQLPVKDGQEFQYSTRIDSQLNEPEDFAKIIVRALPDGSFLRVGDIARVEFGARQSAVVADINGKEAAVFAIQLTPDANSIASVQEIEKVLAEAQKSFLPDMELKIMVDNTDFITQSLQEVFKTFIEALILVLIVVFVFLQNWRATVIPMLAIPVSLIGTFGVFMVLGFTINTLTMFAMILAIGLVVDDAIIVVEAVEHHIDENNLSPKEASFRAMDEVSGPVVAIAFVLASVFIPVAFFGGTVGVLYKQFALTITASMALSAFIALTLTPALCAMLLRPSVERKINAKGILGRFFTWFNKTFNRILTGYTNIVRTSLTNLKLWLFIIFVITGGALSLLMSLPSAFVPDEDQGFFMNAMMLPEATSMNRTRESANKLAMDLKKYDGVENVFAVTGIDIISGGTVKSSSALVGVALKPWGERKTPQTQLDFLIPEATKIGFKYPEMFVFGLNPPALPGASNTGRISFVLADKAGNSTPVELSANVQKFLGELKKHPEVGQVRTSFQVGTPAYKYEIDRDKLAKLGVPLADATSTLQIFTGGYQVNDFTKFDRTWKTLLQADTEYRSDISYLQFFSVRNNQGELIPLSNLVTYSKVTGPSVLTRYNAMRAVQLGGDPAAGYSTGQAMTVIEQVVKETLPTGYELEWTGQSRDEASSGSRTLVVFGLAILFAFLVLAALYESWTIPFSVLFSVPTALLGAAVFQTIFGQTNNIYMQIGLVMLIGLAAKNAILIVEYAKINMDEKGMNLIDGTVEAARLRLRPIIMTSFAFIIGCLPLMAPSGAGAGARFAMGCTVVGGMLFATFLGIFVIPTLFVTVERIVEKFSSKPTESTDGSAS